MKCKQLLLVPKLPKSSLRMHIAQMYQRVPGGISLLKQKDRSISLDLLCSSYQSNIQASSNSSKKKQQLLVTCELPSLIPPLPMSKSAMQKNNSEERYPLASKRQFTPFVLSIITQTFRSTSTTPPCITLSFALTMKCLSRPICMVCMAQKPPYF